MSNTAVEKPRIQVIQEYVSVRKPHLEAMAQGTGLNLDRFLALAFNAVRKTPKLALCTQESWMVALQTAATHGLLPDGVHAALVPYGTEATLVPMYQGLVQRAYETKSVDKIWGEVVYSNDTLFKVSLGTDPKIEHEPSLERGDPLKLVAAYACAIVNGVVHATFLSRADVMRHKASSKAASGSDSPWKNHEAEMWKKTAINVISKTLPHFNADAKKFGTLVHEAEDNDLVLDIPASTPAPPDPPKAPLQDVKERLKATAPKPAAQAQPEPEAVEAERQPGEDDGPESICIHPDLVAQVKAGKLTIASEPPTCEACGESIEPPDLGKLIEMYGPKAVAPAKRPEPAKAACDHTRFRGRKIAEGKLLICPSCDARLSQADIDALGPKQ